MKTITTKKETCEIFGTKSTIILVNGIPCVKLTSISNGLKSGYDSRDKFIVFNYSDANSISYWKRTARTINDVISYLSK